MTRKSKQNKSVKTLVKQTRKMKIQPTPFRNVGDIVGRAAGGMFGKADLGSSIGKWLGTGIGTIFGSGDYTLTGPTPSYNVLTNSNQIPQFTSTKQTNVVCHREYLGDINGTSAFNNVAYPLNPGMQQTFPWLSQIAVNYQEYQFHGVVFEFRPLITDFVTSGQPGVVVMATNYNADSPNFANKQIMENSEFATSVKPTCGLVHGIECATNATTLPHRYVRTGAVPTGQDLRLYDYGNFQVATQNNSLTSAIGELWVTYCVEFRKPLLATSGFGVGQSQRYEAAAVTSASPLGTIITSNNGNLLNFSRNSSSNVSWTAAPGATFLIYCNYWTIATSGQVISVPGISSHTGTEMFWFQNNTASYQPINTTGQTTGEFTYLLSNTGSSDATIGFSLSLTGTFTSPGFPMNVDLIITEVSPLQT
jgi:hypothetical protein